MCDQSEVMNQSQASLGFLLRSRKIHLVSCFAFLGNYGILELFALNARILRAELDYCDLKRVSWVNPNAVTKIQTPKK